MDKVFNIEEAESLNLPLSECEFAYIKYNKKDKKDEVFTQLLSKRELFETDFRSLGILIMQIIPTTKQQNIQNSNKIGWKDLYKTKLCIEHHLNECSRKFNLYVDNEAYVRSTVPHISSIDVKELQDIAVKELDKELVDLFLLIESYLFQSGKSELIKQRISRFHEKTNLAK